MEIKNIVAAINQQHGEIKSVYFVGCGASKAELFPGKYFLEKKFQFFGNPAQIQIFEDIKKDQSKNSGLIFFYSVIKGRSKVTC